MGRCACFTIVRDEPFYLPRWHKHYTRAFDNGDLHLLHHVTSEAEEADGEFAKAIALFANVSRLVNADFDPAWLREVVTEKLSSLLEQYEAVLFAEVDELLVAPLLLNGGGGLRAYIDRFLDSCDESGMPLKSIRCVGYELHHEFPREPALDVCRPIAPQRGRWHRNALYDKALLTRAPLHWSIGFHTCEEAVAQDEAGLVLVHLHKVDFQMYVERHQARAKFKHSDEAIANGWNKHYRSEGPALMQQYMSLPAPLEAIPEWVQEALGEV